jgi:hypothetical protein
MCLGNNLMNLGETSHVTSTTMGCGYAMLKTHLGVQDHQSTTFGSLAG